MTRIVVDYAMSQTIWKENHQKFTIFSGIKGFVQNNELMIGNSNRTVNARFYKGFTNLELCDSDGMHIDQKSPM